jgi:hypothetical protein
MVKSQRMGVSMKCQQCQGEMVKTKVRKFDGCFVGFGYLLAVPAVCVLGVVIITAVMAGTGGPVPAGRQATSPGLAMLVVTSPFTIPSFIALLLGNWLTGLKPIWRCQQCGFFFERV